MREKWGYSGQNFNHTGMHLKIEKKKIPPFKVAKKIHKCNQYGSVTDHLLWHLPLWVKFVNNTLFYTKELLKSMFWAFSLPSDIFINTFPPTFNDLSIIASAHTQRRFFIFSQMRISFF